MYMFSQFVFSFFATWGFCILFQVPKKSVVYSCITGAIGWCVYIVFKDATSSNPLANFLAAVTIGLLGEFFARLEKRPVTIYVIPGIIPLVPGYGIYLAMVNLINNDFYASMKAATDAILVSAAISLGIILVSSIFRTIKKYKPKRIAK